jgi:ABC-type antimicrobial peptide transport system permease subunit
MGERTNQSLVAQRLAMALAAAFAVVALLLTLLGIYGVLTNLVARRTREIGIRMALGSTVAGVFRLVLAEGIGLIGTGLLLGVLGAVAMAGALRGMVFGVQPTDPFIIAAVACATGCAALLACVAPARRATLVNPIDVLSES